MTKGELLQRKVLLAAKGHNCHQKLKQPAAGFSCCKAVLCRLGKVSLRAPVLFERVKKTLQPLNAALWGVV
jgi:hypothetical protein